MANSSFSSFTITQPFLGAPLQFQPALGSKQLEILIDAFVAGSANKQDKLSHVTIDFFNHATVDLLTGALVRRYDVALPYASEHSAYDSQSSGFSPQMFTPSPSSSATFGESLHGSIGTPSSRTNRVTKKAKKETKKTAEAKIPGFQIMTKDGVDVTSSAGRGTKTKEQREHAHLMRIMKACDACKKKKVRCDPSHRRSHIEMSRTSTKTSSSSLSNQSPAVSTPFLSLSRESTNASLDSQHSYETSVIDDFVLFPEDTASWNPADMSLPGFDDQDYNLGQFNFDINDAGIGMSDLDQAFDFSSYEQSCIQQPSYPLHNTGHRGDVQWDRALESQIVGHTRPHQSGTSEDSGNLDSSWFSGTNGGLEFSDSPLSGVSQDSSRLSSTRQTPALQDGSTVNPSLVSFATMDWSTSGPASNGESDGEASPHGGNQFRRPVANTGGLQFPRLSDAAIQRLLNAVPSYSSESGTFVDSTDQLVIPEQESGLHYRNSPLGNNVEGNSRTGHDNIHPDVKKLSALVTSSLEKIKSLPEGYKSLSSNLVQLRDALDDAKSGNLGGMTQGPLLSVIQTFGSELQGLLAHAQNVAPSSGRTLSQRENLSGPYIDPELAHRCSINARKLVNALCVTTDVLDNQNSVQTDQRSSVDSGTNDVQLSSAKHNSGESRIPQDAGLSVSTDITGVHADSRYSCSSSDTQSSIHAMHSRPGRNIRREGVSHLDESFHEHGPVAGSQMFSGGHAAVTAATDTITKVPPHVVASGVIGQQGSMISVDALSQRPSSALVSTSVSSETYGSIPSTSSDHNAPVQQQISQQLLNASAEVLRRVHVTNTLVGTSQLTSIQPTQPSPALLLSRSVGSSADSSLSYSGEYVWGAIPQTVRDKHMQSSDLPDNANHNPRSLEGGAAKNILFSMRTMSLLAASLTVTILQAYSFDNSATILNLFNTFTAFIFDDVFIISMLLVFTIMTLSYAWEYRNDPSSVTMVSFETRSWNLFGSREYSTPWSTLPSNLRRISKDCCLSSWSGGVLQTLRVL